MSASATQGGHNKYVHNKAQLGTVRKNNANWFRHVKMWTVNHNGLVFLGRAIG